MAHYSPVAGAGPTTTARARGDETRTRGNARAGPSADRRRDWAIERRLGMRCLVSALYILRVLYLMLKLLFRERTRATSTKRTPPTHSTAKVTVLPSLRPAASTHSPSWGHAHGVAVTRRPAVAVSPWRTPDAHMHVCVIAPLVTVAFPAVGRRERRPCTPKEDQQMLVSPCQPPPQQRCALPHANVRPRPPPAARFAPNEGATSPRRCRFTHPLATPLRGRRRAPALPPPRIRTHG